MNKLGIIAGMGPMAGINLQKKIIEKTEVSKDQEHIPFLLYNLPQIPDRTEAILYGGEPPLIHLIYAAKALEKSNVTYILIACNTAHFYIDEIQKHIKSKIINMLDVVWEHIELHYNSNCKVGLLATDGVTKSGLYERTSNKAELIYPSKKVQNDLVMEAIYGINGIKAGHLNSRNKKMLISASNSLIEKEVDIIVCGCSEISLVLDSSDISVPMIDPIDLLAQKAIELVKFEVTLDNKKPNYKNILCHSKKEKSLLVCVK